MLLHLHRLQQLCHHAAPDSAQRLHPDRRYDWSGSGGDGLAQNLIGFFVIVGASFGPICGAIAADYLLSGKKWPGPRAGINWAGYISWALGFVVGILDRIPGVPAQVIKFDRPAALVSFVVAFVMYWGLAQVGMLPPALRLEEAAEGAAAS